MRHRHHASTSSGGFHWRAVRLIWPYLLEYRARIALALGFLVLAKAGSISPPLLLKHTDDALDTSPGTSGALPRPPRLEAA